MLEKLRRAIRYFQRYFYESYLLRTIPHNSNGLFDRILIDGSFDNPNYWCRLALALGAIGGKNSVKFGYHGLHNKLFNRMTLKHFGCQEVFDISTVDEDSLLESQELLVNIDSDDDFLKLKFPYGFPSELVYDHILKRQQGATINFSDVSLVRDVAFIICSLKRSVDLIEKYNIDLVLASHCIGWYATMVWAALHLNKKSVVVYGDTGLLRFWKIKTTSDLFDFVDCPKQKLFSEILDSDSLDEFLKEGKNAIQNRFDCNISNLGAYYAFKKRNEHVDREQLLRKYNWKDQPIITVYSTNWFDFPHTFGMKNFSNFYEWIDETLKVAKYTTDVNWLFKGHPVDEWYGGITLESLVDLDGLDHIRFVDKSWSGLSLLRAIDGVVTCHGTVGIEASSLGLPVLNADNGFYDKLGFTVKSDSKEDYLKKLKYNWWEQIDSDESSRKSYAFAGWFWGKARWQKDLIFKDDSEMWNLYKINREILKNKDEVRKEVNTIRDWFESDYGHLNTYKLVMDRLR